MAPADIAADVEALKHDLSALQGDLRSLRSSVVSELRNSASQASDGLSGAARSAMSSVTSAGERGYGVAAKQIEANPVTSVLIAAGIGILIGSMLRR